MRIIWSPRARLTYINILNYLEKEWGVSSVINFISEVNNILMNISKNPRMFISANVHIRKKE